MNISDALTEKMLMVANKISNQKHMYAIKTAFTTLMVHSVHWLLMLFVQQQLMESA